MILFEYFHLQISNSIKGAINSIESIRKIFCHVIYFLIPFLKFLQ